MHAPQVLHRAGPGVETRQLRARICTGVKLPVFPGVELPKVAFARSGFADHLDAFLRLLRIKPQNQSAVPGPEIDSLIGSQDESPCAWALWSVELLCLA